MGNSEQDVQPRSTEMKGWLHPFDIFIKFSFWIAANLAKSAKDKAIKDALAFVYRPLTVSFTED